MTHACSTWHRMLIEEYIEGRELYLSVLGNSAKDGFGLASITNTKVAPFVKTIFCPQ